MGIGAGFVMTYYSAKDKKSYSLMARETAPEAATEDMYATNKTLSRDGPLAIGNFINHVVIYST